MENDVRQTIGVNATFLPIVQELFTSRQKAALLFEDSGVTRANGFIKELYEKDGNQVIRLDNDLEIALKDIYAVNGTFASDYSEC
ncbi:hypothetical protein [Pollutibacter soli]|uniref:hypothetical protein n=1 Tax=Pollutibacter soli TaxID=3034157 RepID=UPI00301383F3